MRAARVDKNHKEIVDAFKLRGASVQSLAKEGMGVPDLLVGYDGINLLVEIKGAKGKLTKHQINWFDKWKGAGVYVIRSTVEAGVLITALDLLGRRELAQMDPTNHS